MKPKIDISDNLSSPTILSDQLNRFAPGRPCRAISYCDTEALEALDQIHPTTRLKSACGLTTALSSTLSQSSDPSHLSSSSRSCWKPDWKNQNVIHQLWLLQRCCMCGGNGCFHSLGSMIENRYYANNRAGLLILDDRDGGLLLLLYYLHEILSCTTYCKEE